MSRLAALLADGTDRVVCFGRDGRERRADELMDVAAQVAARLRGFDGERWALNLDDSFDFTAALLGCWATGRTAVLAPQPLLATLDSAALDGVIEFAGDSTAAADRIVWEELTPSREALGAIDSSAALVLYTSGSTGTPKHADRRLVNVESELAALESAWGADLLGRACSPRSLTGTSTGSCFAFSRHRRADQEARRERSRSLRLVNPRHQHPAGAVAPKLDFADGKIEAGGGNIRGRAGGMSGARPQRAHGRQTGRARNGHHLENVAPNESALGQVRLPQHVLVAAMIGSRQTPAMGASRRRR